MKRYEGLFILNAAGKEEALKDTIDKISAEITAAGGKVETVQKMDKKAFARVADRKHSAGFYVNYVFEGAPDDRRPIAPPLCRPTRRFSASSSPSRPRPCAKPEAQIIPFMANFNKVILAGNLTRDPELRYTPKGTAVAKFGLAVNRTWKSEAGETKEEVSFVDVDAFGRQAEVIAQYMRKGRPHPGGRPAEAGHLGRQKHPPKAKQAQSRPGRLFIH